jgi:hypothetical protein
MASVPGKKKWFATSAAIILSILMALTQKQTQHWKNIITLFTHTLEVTSNNPLPHNNLGAAFYHKGNIVILSFCAPWLFTEMKRIRERHAQTKKKGFTDSISVNPCRRRERP